jgi:hypothetical protein
MSLDMAVGTTDYIVGAGNTLYNVDEYEVFKIFGKTGPCQIRPYKY